MSFMDHSHALSMHAYQQCRAQRELVCALYRGPRVPLERDEGLLPHHNDPVAYRDLFAANSQISGGVVAPLHGMLARDVPPWWSGRPYYGEPAHLDGVPLEPPGGGLWPGNWPSSSGSCCDYARLGMPCFCGRTEDGLSYGGGPEWARILAFDAPVEPFTYGMVDSDWPSIDWRLGVGPGPVLQYPEWFPLHGRRNLQVGC